MTHTPTAEQQAIIDAARRIPLTQGLFALVDECDYEAVMFVGKKWFAHKSRNTFYAETKVGGFAVKMHHVIMGHPGIKVIDHIDHNGLNNCRYNLRVVTDTQNKQNKGMYKNNTSGYPGVFYLITGRGRKYWHAQITRNGKRTLIGRFITKEEAITARKEAEHAYANT